VESSGCSDEFDRMFEQQEEEDEVEGENSGNSIEENTNFWENQLNLLQVLFFSFFHFWGLISCILNFCAVISSTRFFFPPFFSPPPKQKVFCQRKMMNMNT